MKLKYASAIGIGEDVEDDQKKKQELQGAIKVLEISEISLLDASNATEQWRYYVLAPRRHNSTTTTKRELKQQCKKRENYMNLHSLHVFFSEFFILLAFVTYFSIYSFRFILFCF